MRTLLALALVIALPSISTRARPLHEDALPRRADLGAAIRPPQGDAPARVVRVAETSVLYTAGLRAGDDVVAMDGQRFTDAIDFDRRMAALRAGRQVRLEIARSGRHQELAAELAALPFERRPGVEIVYATVTNPRGPRQRAILSRPERATARLPAILFVPWLSCDSIESPNGPAPGMDELLARLPAESGWVLLRVDKPGVGDSEGVCADTDLDTEIAGSRAALTWLARHPWVDPSKIVVMGQSFSGAFLPMIAGESPVAGYVVINSWVRTWMERLLEFERLEAEASGLAAGAVSERQRKLSEFYALFLEQQKTPRQVIRERPELGVVWNDEPEHQYGRSARFHHQLQRLNPGAAWSTVTVPTLVMWSDADRVMHRTDHERLVALVNRNRPGAASLVVVPGADHGLTARSDDGRPFMPPVVLASIRHFLDSLD